MAARQAVAHAAKLPPRLSHFIGGQAVAAPGANVRTLPKIYPGNNQQISEVPIAGQDVVDDAVISARAGFKEWSRQSGTERGRVLHKASRLMRDAWGDITRAEVLDVGKPLAEAEADTSGPDALEFFAGAAPTAAKIAAENPTVRSRVCISGALR